MISFYDHRPVQRSYRSISLETHPDKVLEMQKALATEKFKMLTKIRDILVDDVRKAAYDEKGIVIEAVQCTRYLHHDRSANKPVHSNLCRYYPIFIENRNIPFAAV